MAIEIVRFDKKVHDYGGFDCGNPQMNRYLKEQAGQDARRHSAALFVAVEEGQLKVLGFYTLSSTNIDLGLVPPELQKKLPRYPKIPGIRIGRLAVDVSAQGCGLGVSLVANAAIRSLNNVADWTIMEIDAKDGRAATFYRKLGFCQLQDDDQHMFIMRSRLEEFLGAHGSNNS
jgi:ribosomal protein S18 acetylase RimI-like enzyme